MKINNLLIDSEFKNKNSWNLDNCKIKSNDKGILIIKSKDSIFGIHQKFFQKEKSKLYFKINYKSINPLQKIILGIKVNNDLNIITKENLLRINDYISIIVDCPKLSNIILYLICESNNKDNIIELSKPILYNLTDIKKEFTLKSDLDKLEYFKSYSYDNELEICKFEKRLWEIKKDLNDEVISKEQNLLIKCNNKIELSPLKNLVNDELFLFKIYYENINKLGDINIRYINNDCIKKDNQIYKIFKSVEFIKPTIEIINIINYINYTCLLKNVLLINLTKHKMEKISEQDILRLNYIN